MYIVVVLLVSVQHSWLLFSWSRIAYWLLCMFLSYLWIFCFRNWCFCSHSSSFFISLFQKVRDELERRMRSISCLESREVFDFRKSVEHEELRAFLFEAGKRQAIDVNFDDQQEPQHALGMEQSSHQDNKNQQKIMLRSVCDGIRPTEERDKNSIINLHSFCEWYGDRWQ